MSWVEITLPPEPEVTPEVMARNIPETKDKVYDLCRNCGHKRPLYPVRNCPRCGSHSQALVMEIPLKYRLKLKLLYKSVDNKDGTWHYEPRFRIKRKQRA